MTALRLGSLFDGIGVFPLAAVRCGIEPIWASEIEKAPISITKRHFPDMEHLGDVTKLDGREIPPVHIITFGSPCQNLSQIGNRKGLAGEKSSLFFQAILVLDEPFNALDYKTYNDVKEIIRTLHAEGKTILMTSHNYEDIETLCDEIYAIEDGQLGTLPADEMKRRFRG